MEVVPPGRTGDVFSLGPVMCHDRLKCMAMLDLMSIKSWESIEHGITKRCQIDNEDDESYASDLIIEKQRTRDYTIVR